MVGFTSDTHMDYPQNLIITKRLPKKKPCVRDIDLKSVVM